MLPLSDGPAVSEQEGGREGGRRGKGTGRRRGEETRGESKDGTCVDYSTSVH